MIIPTKHIKLENSLLGLGAEILKHLDKPKTISTLWEQLKSLKGIKSYEVFTLALDFMYLLGVIEFSKGFIRRIQEKC